MASYILLNAGGHILLNAGGAVLLNLDDSGATVTAPPPGGGKGSKHRRRILLPDGRILIPADDAEYRRAVEQIIANLEANEETAEPPKRKRVIKGAVVQPKVPKLAPVRALPAEFYGGLEFHTRGVLNYLAIQSAWKAYEAQMDEEAVEMLLMVS